ncbi:MAG: S9 family peptidase [Anaerolineae bacterium]|nr:S9 family peptidase [Anaerolineae bacterium]
MSKIIPVTEKYERNGWPSIPRPDLKSPDGWSLSLITAQERIRNHKLSPDGKTIAFIKDDGHLSDVFTLPTVGGWPARITTQRGLVAYWDDEIPQWSPDGRWLAFGLDGHVHIVPAAGGLPKKLTDFTESASSPKWMPDSRQIIVSVTRHEANQLVMTDLDGTWPRQLTNDADGDHWQPEPSPNGKSVVFALRRFNDLNRSDICLLDLETDQTRTLYGLDKIRAWQPRFSPDGAQIAFTSEQGGWTDLWLVRPDGEGLRQLSKLGADIIQHEWSPGGKSLAVIVNRGGAFHLGLLDAQSGQYSELRAGNGLHTNPYFTPDGARLTFEYENPLQPPEIYQIDLATKAVSQLTFSFIPALAANRLVMPETVSYKSFDGLEIPAFLYRPHQPNGAAIVHPHGGPSSQYAFEWDVLAQYLVAKGYTFIAPNYRGSTGYGIPFEHANYNDWGGGDTRDCIAATKYLQSLPGIDPARIASMGGSYGGYMTMCVLARDLEYNFACGIAKYGDSNLLSSWAQCKRELRLYTEIFLGHPAKNRAVYQAGSPIDDFHNIRKPVLLLHGLEDDVVPPEASEEIVHELKRLDKTYEYKTYPGEPHGFLMRATQLDVYERLERFLDWYLLP